MFDIGVVGFVNSLHLDNNDFLKLFKENCQIYAETPKFYVPIKKQEKEELKQKLKEILLNHDFSILNYYQFSNYHLLAQRPKDLKKDATEQESQNQNIKEIKINEEEKINEEIKNNEENKNNEERQINENMEEKKIYEQKEEAKTDDIQITEKDVKINEVQNNENAVINDEQKEEVKTDDIQIAEKEEQNNENTVINDQSIHNENGHNSKEQKKEQVI